MRVAVVGGGAVGVTVARDLATAGVDVRLYERDDHLGDERTTPRSRLEGSSHRAAGVLAPRPTDAVGARIAERSLERFRRLADLDHRFEFEPCPQVTVVHEDDEARIASLGDLVDAVRDAGVAVERYGPGELADRFSLGTADLAAGVVVADAGYVVPGPGAYVAAMADQARDAGVDVWTGVEAAVNHRGDGPRVDRERFDAVVVAAGGWTKRVLAPTGVRLPLKPYRVQALVSNLAYDGPMVLDASAGVYFRPHPAGLLAGDGTVPEEVDPERWEPTGDDWFVEAATDAVATRTGRSVAAEAAWAGLSTATPDGEPLVGEVAADLYVVAGWHGHGFVRAPGMAELFAAQVLGEAEPVAAFDPGRFDGVPEFEIREGMAL